MKGAALIEAAPDFTNVSTNEREVYSEHCFGELMVNLPVARVRAAQTSNAVTNGNSLAFTSADEYANAFGKPNSFAVANEHADALGNAFTKSDGPDARDANGLDEHGSVDNDE